MRDQTVSSGFILSLLGYAASRGADREALLTRADIAATSLADRDSRLPFAQYMKLMRAAKVAIGDAALALHFGQATDVSDISIVGLIGKASDTMLDAFAQLNRYVRLIVDVDLNGEDRFVLNRDASGLWLTDMRANPNTFPELTESAFSHILAGPRRAGVPEWIREVHLTHARPAHAAAYDSVFRAPITFSSDRNAMRMEERIVDHKLGILPRYVFGLLTEHADTLASELKTSSAMRMRVERLLLPALHTGDANMEAVAAKLSISRQTLYRTLKAEGVTFEHVLDGLRHRMAIEYLSAKRVSVNETAYLVGFSDPAAFSRAFKRWTGKNPRDMRSS
jgi:AraC-like DNA-binding protein